MARKSSAAAPKAPAAPRSPSKRRAADGAGTHPPSAAGSTPGTASNTLDAALARLNPKQRAFCLEYVADHNAAQAAIRAGYSAATARQIGSRLLTVVDVSTAVRELLSNQAKAVQEKTGITLERTIKEIGRIAFFDPRRLFNADGEPLAITDLDDDTAAAVAGLDVLEEFDGAGRDRVFVGYVKKWKLADKKGALDMLMKHLGGYSEDNRQKADPLVSLLENMARRSPMPVNPNPSDDDDE